jgi:quercetin dioxygenase-like cupin family protein
MHSYSKIRQLNGDLLHLQSQAKGTALCEAARDEPSGRCGETIVKQGPLRVVVLAFTAGSFMHEHATAGPAYMQVLSGQVNVRTSDDAQLILAGEGLLLGGGIRRSLVATTDSTVLLVLAVESPEPEAERGGEPGPILRAKRFLREIHRLPHASP